MRRSTFFAFLAAAFLLAGCGSIRVAAPPASPTVVTGGPRRGLIHVATNDSIDWHCDSFGVRSLCVDGANETMRVGLERMLSGRMSIASEPSLAEYLADVGVRGFHIERNAWNNHVRITLDWSLVVKSSRGALLIEATGRSVSQNMVPFDQVRKELELLQNRSLSEMRPLIDEHFRSKEKENARQTTKAALPSGGAAFMSIR